jgi:hypothetical protein
MPGNPFFPQEQMVDVTTHTYTNYGGSYGPLPPPTTYDPDSPSHTAYGFDVRYATDNISLQDAFVNSYVSLMSGKGNDTITASPNSGMTFIDPGTGTDQVVLSTSNAHINVDNQNNYSLAINDTIYGFGATDRLTFGHYGDWVGTSWSAANGGTETITGYGGVGAAPKSITLVNIGSSPNLHFSIDYTAPGDPVFNVTHV